MSQLQTKPQTDCWVTATWDEYIQVIEDPAYEKAKGYYHSGQMRIEMLPVGSDHSTDHLLIASAINLFAILRGLSLTGRDNCSYRKTGAQECQPDLSYHFGDKAQAIPRGTSIIDLDRYPVPDLVIEVAATSLLDDQGAKRLLYEELGASEYWIIDVKDAQILAFSVADRGSKRIREYQVLPKLKLSILEEALQMSHRMAQSEVGNWLFKQFQQLES
jgi:Uma2 family endonuclease